MKYTDNLKLHLPEGHDPVRREPLNANFNLLDAALQAMSKDLYTTLWEGGHRWRSYKWVPGTGNNIVATATGEGAAGHQYFNLRIADKVSIADDGTVTLVDYVTATYKHSDGTPLGSVDGIMHYDFPYHNKYVQVQPVSCRLGEWVYTDSETANGYWSLEYSEGDWSAVAWVSEDAAAAESSYVSGDTTDYVTGFGGVYTVVPRDQFVALVSADSADAYPDDGWVDHIHYVKAAASTVLTPRLEIGSYVGTGLYGADNPTVLEFTVKPYVVVIQAEDRSLWGQIGGGGSFQGQSLNWILLIRDTTRTASTDQTGSTGGVPIEWGTFLDVTWSDYGLSLCSKEGYAPSAKVQLNTEGVTYRYAVIGHME